MASAWGFEFSIVIARRRDAKVAPARWCCTRADACQDAARRNGCFKSSHRVVQGNIG